MSNPVYISVVMGIYNGAAHLCETIESVLCQADVGLEFIIVDDGSTDPLAIQILSDYEKQDERIRVITKSNEGLTKALIDGCEAATGRYIARIDNGDVMLPERLRKQREFLDDHPNVAFVSCWTEFCGPEWEPLYTHRVETTVDGVDICPAKPDTFPVSGPSHHGSVMFRRKTYKTSGGYRYQFYFGQDWDLWLRLTEMGLFYACPEVLYRARLVPNSISGNNRVRQEQIGRLALEAYWCRQQKQPEMEILQRVAAIRPSSLQQEQAKYCFGEGEHFVGEVLRQNGDKRCLKYFRQALQRNPLRINTWVRILQASRIEKSV